MILFRSTGIRSVSYTHLESSYGAIGTYRTPNLTLDGYGIYTNTPGAGPYRGLGSEILVFAIECQLDRMAEKLGIDKVKIRKKNLLVDGDEDALGQITYNNTSMDALQLSLIHI